MVATCAICCADKELTVASSSDSIAISVVSISKEVATVAISVDFLESLSRTAPAKPAISSDLVATPDAYIKAPCLRPLVLTIPSTAVVKAPTPKPSTDKPPVNVTNAAKPVRTIPPTPKQNNILPNACWISALMNAPTPS